MSLNQLKIIAAIIIIITSLIAAWLPFKKRLQNNTSFDFPIGEALASGVFLGAGLIHMLADASDDFAHHGYDYPFAFLIAGCVFLGLLWLEHLGRELHEHEGEHSRTFAILACVMLSIHSFIAGAALGLSSNTSLFTVLFLAIIAHKWAASFALAIQINKSQLLKNARYLAYLIFMLMTPFGIFVGALSQHLSQHVPLLEPSFSAIAAGTFIYLGTLHGLKRSVMVQKCCNLKHYSFVIAGFALMAIVAIWT